MRAEPNLRTEKYRAAHPLYRAARPLYGATPAGSSWGYFEIGGLRIISSGSVDGNEAGAGWEHVSVSLHDRCPTWDEMKKVKELFWRDDETVIQFHPSKGQYISKCETCLHLWRKPGAEAELPPAELIA
jgi:hypothetical protein